MGFSNMFQASRRYVDSVGEHFTHMLHEVDGLFTPDVCVKKPVSILSMEKKTENSCDENALDDKLSACAKMESVLSDEFADETISNLFSEHNVENKSSACAKMEPVISNVIFDERASNLYMGHNVEGYKESSTGPDENHLNEKMSDSILSDGFVGDPVSNLSPVHNVEDKESSTGPDENALVNKMLESILSDVFIGDMLIISDDAMTKKNGAQEPISLVGFPEKEHEQKIEPNKLKTSLQLPEIETRDGCDREGVLDRLDVLNPIIEQIKAFEDIELNDCEDNNHDIENYELTLIAYRASRNTLYKERLRNTLISKVRSSMGRSRRRVNSFYHEAVSLSSSNDLYKKLLIQDSTESEWELV